MYKNEFWGKGLGWGEWSVIKPVECNDGLDNNVKNDERKNSYKYIYYDLITYRCCYIPISASNTAITT